MMNFLYKWESLSGTITCLTSRNNDILKGSTNKFTHSFLLLHFIPIE